jgi:hypothetical protein
MFAKLLSWMVLHVRSDTANEIEILVLRHQLAVLQRRTPRPQINWSDRAVIAALARLLPARRRRGFLVTPSTILRWHRQLVGRRWTTPPVRTGRPVIPAGVRAVIVRLATENPTWGYRTRPPAGSGPSRRRCWSTATPRTGSSVTCGQGRPRPSTTESSSTGSRPRSRRSGRRSSCAWPPGRTVPRCAPSSRACRARPRSAGSSAQAFPSANPCSTC